MRGERPPELMLSLNFKDCLGPSLPGPLILVRQRRLTLKIYLMKIIHNYKDSKPSSLKCTWHSKLSSKENERFLTMFPRYVQDRGKIEEFQELHRWWWWDEKTSFYKWFPWEDLHLSPLSLRSLISISNSTDQHYWVKQRPWKSPFSLVQVFVPIPPFYLGIFWLFVYLGILYYLHGSYNFF